MEKPSCYNCKFSYHGETFSEEKTGLLCSSPNYNSPEYTAQMLTEDGDNKPPRCRYYERGEG